MLRIYAHCIDGDDEQWFGAMEPALAGTDLPFGRAAVPGMFGSRALGPHPAASGCIRRNKRLKKLQVS
jgi:hypothetical protein